MVTVQTALVVDPVSTDGRHTRSRRVAKVLADRRTVVGTAMVGIVLLVALLGPFFAPHETDAYVAGPYARPSAALPLGADFMGQDVLSRVLAGGRTVVWMSVLAASLGMVLGSFIGMVAGYFRGWIDEIVMRLTDVALAMPTIVFVLLCASVFGRSLWLLVLLIGLSHAPQVARVVRGVTVDVREREYVEYAESLGASPGRVLGEQILPNITGPLMVEYGLRIVWSVAALAGLSVLGQGVMAPTADWGLMINENRSGLTIQPLAVVVPLAMIAIFAIGVNLVAEGIARALAVGTKVSD